MQDNPNPNDQEQQPNTESTSQPVSSEQAVPVQEPVTTPVQLEVAQPVTVTPATTVAPEQSVPTQTPMQEPVGSQSNNVAPTQQPTVTPMSTIPPMAPSGVITGEVQQGNDQTTKKKSPKKLLIIVAAVVVFLFASIGGALAYMSTIPTPAEHLEKAIVNAASTSTVAQSAKMDGSIEGTDTKADISIESDFSDPANPKSKGTVGMEFEIFGVAISLKSEFICVSSTDCYIKYTEYTIPDEMGTEATTAFLNKWLQFNPYDDTAFADPFGMIVGLNTVLGDIITGNISGDAKAKIEQAAKDGSAYSFTTSVEEQVNGKSALKFDVTVNKDKVLELNNAVAAQYKLKDETKSDDIVDKMNVWVATDKDQIVKAESTVDGVKITLDVSKQGESITIEAPTDYLTTDQYSQLFN